MSDFPAAHSMDTMWFGIDADGHVASFYTAEGGPIPQQLMGIAEPEDQFYAAVGPAVLAHAQLHDLPERGKHVTAKHAKHDHILMRTADKAGSRLSTAPRMNTQEFAALHDSGTCLGCTSISSYFISYSHSLEYDPAPGPYERKDVPSHPLQIRTDPAQLPACVFANVHFTSSALVQPIEHTECWIAGDDTKYYDVEGKKRLIPSPTSYIPGFKAPTPANPRKSRFPDFPAAHSMDTTWFAIDANGHIGIFESGEMGAVPAQINSDDSNELATTLMPFLVRQAISRGILVRGQHCQLLDDKWDPHFVTISAAQREEDDADYQELLNDGSGDGAVLQAMYADEYAHLHADNQCGGCCSLSALLYYFHHDEDNDVQPAPYGRLGNPKAPLTFAELKSSRTPPKVVHAFSSLTFAAAAKIQPLEHGPCQNWDASEYLTVDGQVKRIPLHSDQRAQMKKFRNQLKGFKFEVAPPSEQKDAAPNEIRMVLKRTEAPAPRPQPKASPIPQQQQPKKPWWKFW